MTRQHAYQLRQVAAGNCRVCGRPRAGSAIHCPAHVAADAARKRRAVEAERRRWAEIVARGPLGGSRCSQP